MKSLTLHLALLGLSASLAGAAWSASPELPAPQLQLVATSSQYTWNGIAVADDGRIFANFPRWAEGTPSVALVGKDGALTPYPGDGWNTWKPGDDPARHFVSVNSLHVDRSENHLWVVDPATPNFGPSVEGGPKLVEINLATNQVLRVYPFSSQVAPRNSYLNDVRVLGRHAFVTESGTGALLVLDRDSGQVRRLLADSALTKADPGIVPVVDGRPLTGADGKSPQIHADQIELSADRKTLYFMAPFGPRLYRVAVADLLDTSLGSAELERRVQVDRDVPPVGGIAMDQHDTLYLSEIQTHSIRAETPDGRTLWTLTDPRLDWPDAYSITADGTVYMVAAQVDRLPGFHQGTDARQPPYYLFSFKLTAPHVHKKTP
ncbi:SMP-30/gluconolactonase/LRE family protein [Azomonas macrocytogenes]|uniref:Sugar lactone lactonase YvrE n=1 Tax=Azomonas macrocytogenes TaxID=69962 RepID=A0A839T7C9_AZOMA|nr:L-dopachrome tautomerase-related protein [Azomonas macrocytogenes]MBB3104760.1 sugar lactone lactonase YvrE [Azomonas macrocytogenes]